MQIYWVVTLSGTVECDKGVNLQRALEMIKDQIRAGQETTFDFDKVEVRNA